MKNDENYLICFNNRKVILEYKMAEKADSIWFYFHRPVNDIVRCKYCTWTIKQHPSKSTGNYIAHLERNHEKEDLQRKRAVENNRIKKTQSTATPKITSFISSDPTSSSTGREIESPPPEKRARIQSGGSQTIQENIS